MIVYTGSKAMNTQAESSEAISLTDAGRSHGRASLDVLNDGLQKLVRLLSFMPCCINASNNNQMENSKERLQGQSK